MPRDYKQRPARKGGARTARRSAPPPRRFAWFGAGVCVGAAATAALFLVEPGPASLGGGPAPRGGDAAATGTKPRFEFYTLLPEKEIAIPETEIAAPAPAPAPVREGSTRAATAATPPAPADAGVDQYLLQVGSFRKLADADRLKARLALLGHRATIQVVSIDGAETWHRVRVGPFRGRRAASEARRQLTDNELESLVLKLK